MAQNASASGGVASTPEKVGGTTSTNGSNVSRMLRRSVVRLVVLIIVYIVLLALIKFVFGYLSHRTFLTGSLAYMPYVDVPLSIVFGILIVFEFAQIIYWNLRFKLPHPEAASVRSVFRILGIVAVVIVVVSAYVSPTAAAGLGAFAGLVVGFATQQVLGQAIAGLFLSLSRPFKADDKVNIASQEGIVVDVSTLFTLLDTDQAVILVPNNSIISTVIKRYKPQPPQQPIAEQKK